MDIDRLRTVVAQHATSANALVAIGYALERQISGSSDLSAGDRHAAAIIDQLGLANLHALQAAQDLAPVLAGIRADLFFGSRLLLGEADTDDCPALDKAMRQAFGDVSAGFPALLKRVIAPRLRGLPERLDAPGAAFLDIGTGVGALSMAMVRNWPDLRVVGVDPQIEAITLAKRIVQSAGLDRSIELRIGRGEEIADREAFDLAFVPSAFIPAAQVSAILVQVKAALKPGGWLLLAMVKPGSDPLGQALVKFRTAMWGGTVFDEGEASALLERSGYDEVCVLPGPTAAPVAFVAGCRGTS